MIEPYYKQNGITIYNADCRDVLPELETFDLLLTDPPYGIGISKSRLPLGAMVSFPADSKRTLDGFWTTTMFVGVRDLVARGYFIPGGASQRGGGQAPMF